MKELLTGVYRLSRDTILYAEVVTNELQLSGLSELRDTVEHIDRALAEENEDNALKELDNAFEHLRRGAVECIQRAATKTLSETLEVIIVPPLVLRLICLEKVSREDIRKFRMSARTCIVEGRSKKASSKTWIEAIDLFRKCIEDCDDIREKFPDRAVIKWRLYNILFGLITTISFLFGMWAVFFR